MHAAEEGVGGRDGVVVVEVVEEEEVWCEKRQGREGEVQGCCRLRYRTVQSKSQQPCAVRAHE